MPWGLASNVCTECARTLIRDTEIVETPDWDDVEALEAVALDQKEERKAFAKSLQARNARRLRT